MDQLETERLRLRPAIETDAHFVLALLNDPGYLANIADRGVRGEAEAAEYIRSAQVFRYGPDGLGFNVVELTATGEPIGICGLVKRDTLDHVDVGYALLEDHAGRGYAREAAAAALAHALGPLGLERVVAITSPENVGSRRVLEAIGMRYEGLLAVPGYDRDSALYAAGRAGVGSAPAKRRAS
jgi:RimJ/RimL family protein N-acetyltransferase